MQSGRDTPLGLINRQRPPAEMGLQDQEQVEALVCYVSFHLGVHQNDLYWSGEFMSELNPLISTNISSIVDSG
jgi:hypothetical protein